VEYTYTTLDLCPSTIAPPRESSYHGIAHSLRLGQVRKLRLLLQAPVQFVLVHLAPYCNHETTSSGHPQSEHDTVTSHGSMSKTRWAIDGDEAVIQVQGRKFGANDDGAPMLVRTAGAFL
jgi:hypothetical protein